MLFFPPMKLNKCKCNGMAALDSVIVNLQEGISAVDN